MPSKATHPLDIEEILHALATARREIEALCAATPVERLEAAPAGGGWSVAQVLAHLALTNFQYLGAMREAVMRARHLGEHARTGPLKPGWPTRLFLHHLEPPVKQRVKAPKAIAPAEKVDARLALREFLQSQQAAVDLLEESADLDLNRIRFVNPLVPGVRFTVGAGFLILAAHERRHLWQAAQGLASMAPSNR
jgi:hypothetical protein